MAQLILSSSTSKCRVAARHVAGARRGGIPSAQKRACGGRRRCRASQGRLREAGPAPSRAGQQQAGGRRAAGTVEEGDGASPLGGITPPAPRLQARFERGLSASVQQGVNEGKDWRPQGVSPARQRARGAAAAHCRRYGGSAQLHWTAECRRQPVQHMPSACVSHQPAAGRPAHSRAVRVVRGADERGPLAHLHLHHACRYGGGGRGGGTGWTACRRSGNNKAFAVLLELAPLLSACAYAKK